MSRFCFAIDDHELAVIALDREKVMVHGRVGDCARLTYQWASKSVFKDLTTDAWVCRLPPNAPSVDEHSEVNITDGQARHNPESIVINFNSIEVATATEAEELIRRQRIAHLA